MGRPYRIKIPNLSFHVLNRGNGKQNIFLDNSDFGYYLKLIKRYKEEFRFKLHHLCLMPNHIHFHLKPTIEDSLPKIMQRLTLAHTWYFNKKYNHVGHVWQGRYKSSLLEESEYYIFCGIYIELNPHRAGLVQKPEDWQWSSCNYYAHNKAHPLIIAIIDPDPLYLELGKTPAERQIKYCQMINNTITKRSAEIKQIINQDIIGSPSFQKEMREKYKIVSPRSKGRPRKNGVKSIFSTQNNNHAPLYE